MERDREFEATIGTIVEGDRESAIIAVSTKVRTKLSSFSKPKRYRSMAAADGHKFVSLRSLKKKSPLVPDRAEKRSRRDLEL